ncbi:hypothetical protein CM15mP5_2720 [bacterium]|nr:MAG: hypothetical protein CM15mP5_2720 [bacterium]
MVRNTGHTSKYYLISRLTLSFLFTIPLFGQDSTKVDCRERFYFLSRKTFDYVFDRARPWSTVQ